VEVFFLNLNTQSFAKTLRMDGWVMVSTRTKPGSVSIAAEKMVAEPCLIMTTEEWWWRWGLVSGESQFVSPAAAALLL
jgi:hypothetical protein